MRRRALSSAPRPQHTERVFEASIEAHLTSRGGWSKGAAQAFQPALALDPGHLFAFLPEGDRLFFEQVLVESKADPDVRQRAEANDFDNFALSMRKKVEDVMLDRMEQNSGIVTRFLNDPEFRELLSRELARRIYTDLRDPGPRT